MKPASIILLGLFLSVWVSAQELKPLNLLSPDTNRGLPVMKALSVRESPSTFNTAPVSFRDLSDLLWAANGVNRSNGKRTAPSAINAQDIDVYAVTVEGAYLYNAAKHVLEPVAAGDHRAAVAGRQEEFKTAPLFLVLVSDLSRFRLGSDSVKMVWAAMDAGIVSQNIAVFCASAGLECRPRITMDQGTLREVLKLKPTQLLMLNDPVGVKPE